jgi:eukaryotic-like serine/threonine-protein kinase
MNETSGSGTWPPSFGRSRSTTEAPASSAPPPGPPAVLPPEVFSLRAGDVLAERYRIVRPLGHGGMGAVYEALHLELGESVALKTLRSLRSGDASAQQRFRREALLAYRVTHPNVCRLFELARHRPAPPAGAPAEEVLFVTMELLSGETLAGRLGRRGALPEPAVRRLASQMVAALAAAHAAGVIHRDFKSGNVMLVPGRRPHAARPDAEADERLVVTDFGLAQAYGEPAAGLTRPGAVLGTLATMAPEQIAGDALGPATDVYALGVVLFEMLTARLPFEGPGHEVLAGHLARVPPAPRELRPELDAAWDTVILRCLRKAPAERYADVREVLRDLEQPSKPRPAAAALPAAPGRPAVALLGFKNLAGRAEDDWLSTALGEMLGTELAAGKTLRVVSGEEVARMQRELALPQADSYAPGTLERIRSHLAADLVVLGSYLSLAGSDELRVSLRFQDTRSAELPLSVSEKGTESEIFDLIASVGQRLREQLGLGERTEQQVAALRSALPADPRAARLYAEGLAKLRQLECLEAKDLLEEALALAPDHPLLHSALSEAWDRLGTDRKAREHAGRAFALSAGLPRPEHLALEGRYREANGQWDRAVAIYRGLSTFYPDHLEHGLRLVGALCGAEQVDEALAVAGDLRRLPAPDGEDPRIDLAEAAAAVLAADSLRAREAAGRAVRKGAERGMESVAAEARLLEWQALFWLGEPELARKVCGEARRLFAALGNAGGEAQALLGEGFLLWHYLERFHEAEAVLEKVLGIARRIGDRRLEARALQNLGRNASHLGQPDRARRLLEQALQIYEEVGASQLLRSQALQWHISVLRSEGRMQEARNLAQGALDRARAAHARLAELRAESSLAWIDLHMGRPEAALGRAEPLLEDARRRGDLYGDVGVAELLFLAGRCWYRRGRMLDARRCYQEALDIWSGTGSRIHRSLVLAMVGQTMRWLGDQEGARRSYEAALVLARESGNETGEAWQHFFIGRVSLDQGLYAQARERFLQAREIFVRQGVAGMEVGLLGELGEAWAHSGAAQRAEDLLRGQLRQMRAANAPRVEELAVLAGILRQRGRLDEAEAALAEARPALAAGTAPQRGAFHLEAARLLALRGDAAAGRRELDRALEAYGEQRFFVAGEPESVLAELLLDEGRHAEAEASAREALESFRRRGCVDGQTRALALVAQGRRRQGDLAGAQDALERARERAAASESAAVVLAVELERARWALQAADAPETGLAAAGLPPLLERARVDGRRVDELEAGLVLGRLEREAVGAGVGDDRIRAVLREAEATALLRLAAKTRQALHGGRAD